jgi:crotonobetaine/carnitine-CoA ligase
VRRFLDGACERRGGAPFLFHRGTIWSYAAMGAMTDGLAAELVALGVLPGDRVAMQLPTGPEHLFLWLATAKAGIVSCPIHPDLAPPEVERAIALLEPRAVVDRSGAVAIGGRVAARLSELLASDQALRGVDEPSDESIATILTTSGTTGAPKAAMLPHRMAILSGEGFAHWLHLTEDDRLFTCLPLSHVNARFYTTLGAVAAGASIALEERFSASRFWSWLRDSGATEVNVIGAMLRILAGRPAGEDDRAHRVRVVYGALAIGRPAHLAFEKRFGTRLVVGYGLTESTFGLIQPDAEPRDLDAMGLPRRHPDPSVPAEVRLVDGEIWLRNPATFAGYFRDDAATREALTPDGWLKTGDLARQGEDGAYTFLGRKKLVIRRRGENLSPSEVEAVLEAHPAVREAAVLGVPSPLGEDDVMACVVFHEGAAAGEHELAAYCATRLASFKVPSLWLVLDALPRTSTERIAYHLIPTKRRDA